ncbi:MAG: hypothetical protein ACT6Q8_22055 [Niveispirillum sp.]|uniref:hypothetical protein n=1 Tax=Niveispirillum sp. TaxID=1917217 RepID=UPI004035569E
MGLRSPGRHSSDNWNPLAPVAKTPHYTASRFDLYDMDAVGQKRAIPGEPRTFGIKLRVDF